MLEFPVILECVPVLISRILSEPLWPDRWERAGQICDADIIHTVEKRHTVEVTFTADHTISKGSTEIQS